MKWVKGCKTSLAFPVATQFDITYSYWPGFPGTREEPPEPAEVEVTALTLTIGEAEIKVQPDSLGEELLEKICDALITEHEDAYIDTGSE